MNHLRILIVEDEAVAAIDLQNELLVLGYVVTGIADTAADAVRLAEDSDPDLVLMDINLGEIDGIHAAYAVRSQGIPVIFLTAHYDDRTLERATRAKPVGYIAKPYKRHDLVVAIEIGIARHRTEAERARLTREIAEAKQQLQQYAVNLESTVAERTAELRQVLDERHHLQGEVLRIAEQERRRVAADLHDGICQELVNIQISARMLGGKLETEDTMLAAEVQCIENAISEAARHTRQVARAMDPVVAEGGGLMTALQMLADSTADSQGIDCSFECPEPVDISTPATASELYHITQEAIHNALHHGRAERITIYLSQRGEAIKLAIVDNGCGLPAVPSPNPQGMGMRVMKYRAGLIGGELVVQPSPRGGTEVICRIAKQPVEHMKLQ